MAMARSDLSSGAALSRVAAPDHDRAAVELALVVARKRADACSQGGPSWDAAMGLVDDLERALRQFDEPSPPAQIRQHVSFTGS
jgi:hypothetical protein